MAIKKYETVADIMRERDELRSRLEASEKEVARLLALDQRRVDGTNSALVALSNRAKAAENALQKQPPEASATYEHRAYGFCSAHGYWKGPNTCPKCGAPNRSNCESGFQPCGFETSKVFDT